MEPFQQGEFDGLCAVYSTINAIRLTLGEHRPLSYQESVHLFGEAICYIDDRDHLRHMVTRGTNFIFWMGLQRHLCKVTTATTGFNIKIERPFKSSKGVTLTELKRQTLQYIDQNKVCLAALAGSYKHYTAIDRASSHRLWLFDSYGYSWVNWNRIRVGSRNGSEPHILRPSSLSAFFLVD